MTNFYFETSAVNYLMDNVFSLPEYSSIKTKEFQIRQERKWFISALTLWEIFLTKNDLRRYELFDFSRCLFYDNLIPTPEEVIVNYIRSGCPEIEERYDLESKSIFAKEWRKACKDLSFAFQPDKQQLEERTKYNRIITETFESPLFVSKSLYDLSDTNTKLTNAFLKGAFLQICNRFGSTINEDLFKFITVVLKVTLLLLCYGIGMDNTTVESFWGSIGKLKPLERLDYTIKYFPDIFNRGPITNIAKMIIIQIPKSGRGLYFDSLHSSYITYSDLYITNDQHFINFKNAHSNDPNMNKVINVKDLTFHNV